MLKKAEIPQEEMEFLSIGSLVPDDHLLRKIDAAVDFAFIRERVRRLYCADNGRPALDPVILFKLLCICYLFGIRSERQLTRGAGQRRLPLVSADALARQGSRRLRR